MSLDVSESGGKSFPILPEGTHLAICHLLVDLGEQYSEVYKNSSRKVMIGWELPEVTIELNGELVPRTYTQRYTASLNEKSALRRDLSAWRGKAFTPEELRKFNLRNIVGAPCMLQIVHKDFNGKEYASMASIIKLYKGIPTPVLSGEAIVYDIDENDPADVDKLPEWIANIVKESESYQTRSLEFYGRNQKLEELADEAELPF